MTFQLKLHVQNDFESRKSSFRTMNHTIPRYTQLSTSKNIILLSRCSPVAHVNVNLGIWIIVNLQLLSESKHEMLVHIEHTLLTILLFQ